MNDSFQTPGGSGLLGGHAVSRIGYGAMRLEKFHNDRAGGLALLRRALEFGVNHFDTAQFYGNGLVNGLLREAVVPHDQAVIVTKVGADPDPGAPIPLRPAQKPAELRASVEASLRALGVDQLAVVNLRRLDVGPGITVEGEQVVDIDDQLAVLSDMRDEGKIGAIGLSSVNSESLRRALPVGIVCVQNAYSLLSRESEDMLQTCTDHGIAWVPFFPLGGGGLMGAVSVVDDATVRETAADLGATPSQIGLAWLLQHSANTLLIPGTASSAHLAENVAAGEFVLPAQTMATLDSLGSASA